MQWPDRISYLFILNACATLRVMMGYTLAPETLQVIEAAALAVGLVFGMIVFAMGLAHFGGMFINSHMD